MITCSYDTYFNGDSVNVNAKKAEKTKEFDPMHLYCSLGETTSSLKFLRSLSDGSLMPWPCCMRIWFPNIHIGMEK